MTDYKSILNTLEYEFLKTNPHLGNNIILLGLGGSHAYGTNTAGSDLDIRGVALSTKEEILRLKNFDQVVHDSTDTVVYSFYKMVSLLTSCNPNVVEILGLRPEHYLYVSPVGQELLDNKNLFLSKEAVKSFNGYATSSLKKIEHNTTMDTKKLGKHMMHIIRLYLMCIDILEKGEVITYREQELELLMRIRNGEYIDKDFRPTQEFYDLVAECKKRLQYAEAQSTLPDTPDYEAINKFIISVHERIVLDTV